MGRQHHDRWAGNVLCASLHVVQFARRRLGQAGRRRGITDHPAVIATVTTPIAVHTLLGQFHA